MRALHAVMAKAALKVARDFLVLAVIVAVADRSACCRGRSATRRHGNARARVSHAARRRGRGRQARAFLPSASIAFDALFGRQAVRRLGTDRRVIERLLAARAHGIGVHFDERADQVLRDGALDFEELMRSFFSALLR